MGLPASAVTFFRFNFFMKKLLTPIGVAALVLAAVFFTGCASNHKTTVLRQPVRAYAAVTPNGTVVYPTGWQTVTNGAGAVQTLPIFATITVTNPQPFSLGSFFGGGIRRVELFSDEPYEYHRGGGVNLLVDSKYNQLDSQFSESARFGGSSHLWSARWKS
jgi:hypothetical protein